MKSTAFENAQMGDCVYDNHWDDFGIICGFEGGEQGIKVKFANITVTYTREGKRYGSIYRTLYWDKPILPEEPKRKVKKIVDGWINLYVRDSECNIQPSIVYDTQKEAYVRDSECIIQTSIVYDTQKEANEKAYLNRLGEALHIYHEYWIEE